MTEVSRLRPAVESDFSTIRKMVREARLNPLGLEWRRFIVAMDDDGKIIGCGQVKSHNDGSTELASLVVRRPFRGMGIARAIVERLMAEAEPPLWLMCRSRLARMYQRFGFVEEVIEEEMPRYFRRMRSLARLFRPILGGGEGLAIMRWGVDTSN